MTKREIVSLVIKLMGVFILLKSIAYVPMVFSQMFSVMRTEGALFAIFVVLTSIIIAGIPLAWSLLIIFQSDKVAAWLIKEQDDMTVEVTGSIQKEDIMLVVFTCIGLYLIVTAFPSLILDLSRFFTFRRASSDYVTYTSSGLYKLGQLIAQIVQLALGIWLFAGSKGVVKLWKKIRS